MQARIYHPAKTAMQSGRAGLKKWVLEFIPRQPQYREPLMGWTGMRDTCPQIKLFFETEEEATQYAQAHNIPYQILKTQMPSFKPRQYSDNFSPDRLIPNSKNK